MSQHPPHENPRYATVYPYISDSAAVGNPGPARQNSGARRPLFKLSIWGPSVRMVIQNGPS